MKKLRWSIAINIMKVSMHIRSVKLIESGANAKDIARRLGHADATINQNLYTQHAQITSRNGKNI